MRESLFEQVEKLTLENDAQGFNREEKIFPGRTPALLIVRQSSSGDQTMEMKMIQQGLVPGMEHRDETDLPAKMGVTRSQRAFRQRL